MPILFPLRLASIPAGHPALLDGFLQLEVSGLHITGVTRDSSGAVLGGCAVHLFRTVDDLEMEQAISDPTTGVYSFSNIGLGEQYYVVAYKAGSPDVTGATVNTLTGS